MILVRPASSESTPWATGLTVTAMVAGISGATVVVLTLALRAVYGWLCIPANLLLGAGLAPSVWMLRKLPTWRWVSYGVAIGFACAWIAVALGALFRARG